MMRSTRRTVAAFTLIEVMISVAVIAVIVTLAAPSFREMILMQRLRGINAQLVTDLKFARSEAVSRNAHIQVQFQYSSGSTGMSCYIIFARIPPSSPATPGTCDCAAAAGSRCTDASTTTEVRTVQLPNSDSIFLANAAISGGDVIYSATANYVIDPRTGAMPVQYSDEDIVTIPVFNVDVFIDATKKFRTSVDPSGRPAVCAPSGSTVGGLAC